ncbi:P-loop containing nucleoside triphosphate hydrolase protein [Pavlovales sp. CCMP2436]|nr:P-loop containing nucleoside triphosphate hydrolase protein [Pavlovales sp. CCMP2436]
MVWALPPDDEGSGRGKLPRQFVFDRVVPPEGMQEDVYTSAAQKIVGSVLEGFTGCVMCYGQTGAGKTYTLANESAGPNAGVMLRAFTEIFEHIAQDASQEYEVSMSYVQVYLDTLSDLLTPRNDVQIREDADRGVFLTGLTWRSCKTVRDAKSVLADGNRNRATAATSMNQDSSRSHAVLQMHISRRGGTRTLLGKLYLVDLAGSERVKKSGVEGAAMDEAIAINQSLTILGRCIEAMARGKKGERPPFRESKLTRLLSNAIGGTAKTTLIVCVAPSRRDVVETNSSLEFGQQAMNVIVRAKVNATVDYGGLNAQLQVRFFFFFFFFFKKRSLT